MRNLGVEINSIIDRLAAEKKKSIIVASLIAVMVFMWIRVFSTNTTNSAKGNLTVQKEGREQVDSYVEISFVELPNVKGRHNVLTRDFFKVNEQGLRANKGVHVLRNNGGEELSKQIAGKLKLEAIMLDKQNQAFINNKLLSVGDSLTVSDGVEDYKCEVIRIEKSKVFILCDEAKVSLTLELTNDTY